MTDERLPDAELEVLACLWQHGESTVREVRERMQPYRPLAHASVVTLLGRLETKGWVKKRKGDVGKAFVYKAARQPNRTQRRLVRELLERVFGGDGVALFASLLESKPPTLEQVDELQKLLDELRAKRQKKR